MTKKQIREHKQANQRRRAAILSQSFKQKAGDNMLVFLGGVCQAGRYSR